MSIKNVNKINDFRDNYLGSCRLLCEGGGWRKFSEKVTSYYCDKDGTNEYIFYYRDISQIVV